MPPSRYAITAVVVHWLTALALLPLIALGLRISDAGGAERDSALALHMSLGVCVLVLAIFRIIYRTVRGAPSPAGTTLTETRLAKGVHWALCTLLIAIPVLGWLNVSAASAQSSSELFGFIPWPHIPAVAGNSAAGELAQTTHRLLAYLVCALLALHVAGAIRHHVIDPRTGLARILPGEGRMFGWRSASVAVVLTLLFTMAGGYADSILPRALHMVRSEAAARPAINPRKSTVFASLVQPIFEEKCAACHGDGKQEGGLRLDSFAALSEGGEHGKVIQAGKVHESELVRRLMLPKSDRDAMPPARKPVVAPAEAQLILWWIGAGGDDKTTIVAANPPPLVQRILLDLGIKNESPVFLQPVAPASPEVIARLRATFQLRRLYAEGDFMRAQAQFGIEPATAPSVAALAEIADQLVWLDLSGTSLADEQLQGLDRLERLQRLNLAGTNAGDDTIVQLKDLPYLEILNLYDTAVSDAALATLARMPSLSSLYLSRTAVTRAGIERFTRDHPQIRVVWQATPVGATVTALGRENNNAQSSRSVP